ITHQKVSPRPQASANGSATSAKRRSVLAPELRRRADKEIELSPLVVLGQPSTGGGTGEAAIGTECEGLERHERRRRIDFAQTRVARLELRIADVQDAERVALVLGRATQRVRAAAALGVLHQEPIGLQTVVEPRREFRIVVDGRAAARTA